MPRAYRIPALKLPDGAEEVVSVREHPTARRARLKVLPPGRIEAVVPKGFGSLRLRAFIEDNRRWLEETLRLSRARWAAGVLPEAVELPALGERWPLVCRQGERVVARERAEELAVQGPDEAARAAALRRWLARKGRSHLPSWLAAVAVETGLRYRSVSIRSQRTRWGSCSARGAISLNCALLLLPSRLVHYVLVHELCHTRHLNHSAAFWATVASHQPGHRALEAELRELGARMPAWLRYP